MLAIPDWNKKYEVNRTREMKKASWLPLSNDPSTDEYLEIVNDEVGAETLGVFVAILMLASRCNPRGALLRDSGAPHDTASIARTMRLPEPVVARAIQRLLTLGSIVEITHQTSDSSTAPHEPAGLPQQGAPSPHEPAGLPHEGAVHVLQEREGENARRRAAPSAPHSDYTAKILTVIEKDHDALPRLEARGNGPPRADAIEALIFEMRFGSVILQAVEWLAANFRADEDAKRLWGRIRTYRDALTPDRVQEIERLAAEAGEPLQETEEEKTAELAESARRLDEHEKQMASIREKREQEEAARRAPMTPAQRAILDRMRELISAGHSFHEAERIANEEAAERPTQPEVPRLNGAAAPAEAAS